MPAAMSLIGVEGGFMDIVFHPYRVMVMLFILAMFPVVRWMVDGADDGE